MRAAAALELDGLQRSWRAQVADALREALPDGPVALCSFPNHRNAGDVALWLAAEANLAALGRAPAYRCAWNGFSARALRRRVGDGPILLNGGGNFGDLYEGQQGLRERILATCRDNPIVQLPQSIWFEDQRNLERVQRLVEAHGNVTILCRDERSRAFADGSFAARAALCPDLALTLDPSEPPRAPSVDVLWLARTDPEAVTAALTAPDVEVVDWLPLLPHESRRAGAPLLPWFASRWALRWFDRSPFAADRLWWVAAAGFDPIARAWVDRGRRLLARGRVVVTDRLHAHILALLMGIPSVVLDSTYGKVHAVARQWTATSGSTHLAGSADEAIAVARSLVAESDR